MGRFVEEQDRKQDVLLPTLLDDSVCEDNPVRVIDEFIDKLDLVAVGFSGATPAHTGAQHIIRRRCSTSTFIAT